MGRRLLQRCLQPGERRIDSRHDIRCAFDALLAIFLGLRGLAPALALLIGGARKRLRFACQRSRPLLGGTQHEFGVGFCAPGTLCGFLECAQFLDEFFDAPLRFRRILLGGIVSLNRLGEVGPHGLHTRFTFGAAGGQPLDVRLRSAHLLADAREFGCDRRNLGVRIVQPHERRIVFRLRRCHLRLHIRLPPREFGQGGAHRLKVARRVVVVCLKLQDRRRGTRPAPAVRWS